MQTEILADGVIADMVSFMWRHRCWGTATLAAGLKADFMSIFVEVTHKFFPQPSLPENLMLDQSSIEHFVEHKMHVGLRMPDLPAGAPHSPASTLKITQDSCRLPRTAKLII